MLRISLLLLILPSFAFASPELREEFRASFYSHYEEGKCADNIRTLLGRAKAKGAELNGARVGIIRNGGYLLSTTHRRNSGKEKLAAPIAGKIRFAPGIKNFYYHVILESEGVVYDYDFANEPRVLPTKDYLRQMFWDEPADTEYSGLEDIKFRADYRIDFRPAENFLRDRNAPGVTEHDLSDLYDSL